MSRETASDGRTVSTIRPTERLRTLIPERGDPIRPVLGLSLALFVGFSLYLSWLYRGFALTGADFGSYVHMFATTLAGEGWLLQGKYVPSHPGGSYWGGHFSLTLLLFYPLYALVPSPYTLIVAKSAVLAASVPLLWILVREHVESTRLAGLVVVSYALNPFLWSAWSFDFQEQSLLPLLIFGTYYAYAKRRYAVFLALLALVLLTNEFTVFVVGGFLVGLAVAAYRGGGRDRLRRELPIIGTALALVGGVHLLAGWVISQFSRFSGLPVGAISPPLRPFVEGTRTSIGQLGAVVLADPGLLLDSLAFDASAKVLFFVLLLVPLAFSPLVDELSLGALLPYVGFAWLLAGKHHYYSFLAHYPLYLLPFLYIGAVRVLGRRSLSSPSRGQVVALSLALVMFTGGVAASGITTTETDVRTSDDHRRTLEAAIEQVPPDASLITQNDVYPHVATRPKATFTGTGIATLTEYQDLYGPVSPEYVLFDTRLGSGTLDWSVAIRQIYTDRVGEEYGIRRYEDGIYVLQRGYDGPPEGITREQPGSFAYDASQFAVGDGRFENGRIVSDTGTTNPIWFGPYATLPAGTYTATFAVNATRSPTGARGDPIATVDVAAGEDHAVLAREPVRTTNGTENVTVDFTLDEAQGNVEFRGSGAGNGTVAFEGVSVALASRGALFDRGPTVYEPSDLYLDTGRIENGRIVGRGTDAGRTIWFGPYATLPAGAYTATFQVNVTSADEPVAALEVAAGAEHEVLARELVRDTDGTENVTVEFTLDRPRSKIEFRGLEAGGSGTISLERVSVEARTDSTARG